MIYLEEEIKLYKVYIVILKSELVVVCRRFMSDDGLSEFGYYIFGVVIFLMLFLLFRVLVD